jgi:hypothetical protein
MGYSQERNFFEIFGGKKFYSQKVVFTLLNFSMKTGVLTKKVPPK